MPSEDIGHKPTRTGRHARAGAKVPGGSFAFGYCTSPCVISSLEIEIRIFEKRNAMREYRGEKRPNIITITSFGAFGAALTALFRGSYSYSTYTVRVSKLRLNCTCIQLNFFSSSPGIIGRKGHLIHYTLHSYSAYGQSR